MLKKLAILAFAALLTLPAHAQTYKTKAQIQTEITTNLPDNTTGAITPAITRTTLNDVSASYQQNAGVNAQTGTSYAFVTGDNGQLVTFTNASAISVTLSQASAAGFNPWNAWACNIGNSLVTITPSTSTINGATTLLLSKGDCAHIVSDGTNYQLMQAQYQGAQIAFTLTGVNFNSANTDNQFPLALPPGYSNYLVNAVYISGASHTLVTATFGVFTASAGGGTAIVSGSSSITVSGTTSGAANSAQSATIVGANTVMWSLAGVPTLFFRVQNAEGAAATGAVTIVITPVS